MPDTKSVQDAQNAQNIQNDGIKDGITLKFEKPVALTTAMKESLAICYGMTAYREYLENMINSLIVLSAMSAKDMNEISEYRGAIKYVEKILNQSKTCYYDYDKIKKMEERLTTK